MSPLEETPGVAPRRAWLARLLWTDGLAGLSAGVLVLGLRSWLSPLYGLPPDTLAFIGLVNLVYGTCGVGLAAWRRRRGGFVGAMALANAGWAGFCLSLVLRVEDRATPLGIFTLLFEAAFVGTLALVEWQNRDVLVERVE